MRYWIGCILISFACTTAFAESKLNFAKTVQNPLGINPEAQYLVLPLVNYVNFDYGENDNTQEILNFKPIVPLPLTENFDLISRTFIPFTHQPVEQGYVNGLGDINPTFFLTPAKTSHQVWGLGPTVIMPTATDENLGAGKWSLGPELVLIAMPERWTFSVLVNNVWSVAGQSDRPAVNELTLQYYITYNFHDGWYATTQPSNTADWKVESGEKWTIPVGAGIGRAFHIEKQAVNFLLQAYYNPVRPSNSSASTIQATFEFLFQDKRTTK